ncbi:MAG: hypothetical protein Q7T21_03075 [Gallionella sp.]|nr:hypothetical protein [Gallionella sp.]
MKNPNIQTLVDLARELMDGQQPPPAGPKLDQVENAVRELQKHQSTAEFELLGIALLGALIDRVGSNIQAEKTLRQFIGGGN